LAAAIEPLEARRLLAANLVISEFMASNSNSITDSFGEHSDWIEIHNAGDAPANLNDYFLTDTASAPEEWRFPVQSLAADGYLVVFASGRDLAVAGQELHTNFKLGAGGEYLGLIRATDDSVQFDYAPTFPAQSADISYGLFDSNNPTSTRTFFATPTPGAVNTPSATAATYSQPGKAFTGSLQVALSSPTPGAQIHYTTDGSVPTASSALYSAPLNLTRTTVIRSLVQAAGYTDSPINSQSYVAVDSSLSAFSSNIPIVVLDTFGIPLNQTTNVPAAATFIDAPGGGSADMLGMPDFDGRIGLRIRGSTSANYPKQGYAVELWDEANDDRKAPLLGMPAQSDWVLMDPYSEKSLMQNDLAMKWANETGHYASRTKFVEVYLNTTGGSAINYSSNYWGVYILMEKIKADPNRVDITKMGPDDNTGDAVTGGYMFKKDRADPGEVTFTTSADKQKYVMVEPDENDITSAQLSYISGYMNDLESALYGPNFADPVNGYAKYIDVDSFVDFYLVNEMTRNVDAFWLSTFFYKDRDGKVALGPVWDFNLSMGNANYRDGADSAGWNHDTLTANQYGYFPRLFQDPNFVQKVSDRWAELRSTVFATPKMMADIDADVAELSNNNGNYPVGTNPPQTPDNPVVRNFQRWPVLGTFISSNSFYDPQGRWIEDVNMLKNWMTGRLTWMDAQFVPAPTLTPGGGHFSSPVTVSMTPHAQATGTDTTLIGPDAQVRAIVPSGNIAGWQNLGYTVPADWLTGTTGVGYDTDSTVNFLPYINLNVQSQMLGKNSSIYTRITFNIDDPNAIESLILKMRYDDGFIAWINGVRVMDANSPENINPAWNTAAAGSGNDNLATTYREFDISSVKNELVAGTNVLAIQGLNSGSGSADLLIDPMLVSRHYSSAETGAIYYTTDGTDPRASGGGIAPGAMLYNGALQVSSSEQILARTLSGGVWSALADQLYNFQPDTLRITEMMYNPPAPTEGSAYDAQDFEFIEFKNTGGTPLDLSGYHFTDGIEFTFPDIVLAPGAYGVVVKNQAAFESRYGTSLNILGQYSSGSLDNGGENVAFANSFDQVLQSFTYDDAWYPQTDGGGYSLVIRDPLGDVANGGLQSGWRASYAVDGAPGADDSDTTPPVLQSAGFDPGTSTMQFTFSEPVTLAVPSGLSATELVSGESITTTDVTISSNILSIVLAAPLSDGIYSIALPGASVTDSAGNAMAGDTRFTFLLIADGHTLQLPANGSTWSANQLAIGAGAKLDLSNDDLIVASGAPGTWGGSAYDGITGMIANGTIESSLTENRRTTLGVATAGDIFGISGSQTATFDGQTVSASDVLIKFTYAGDANLDGKINIDDYGRIDANVGQSGAVFGWYNGDFNFDGKINIDDYGLIDSVIGSQGPVL
jgi:hypothetical protein